MSRRRAGFTLIEMMIVVVIIGLLAAIALPNIRKTKGKANTATLRSDLRNLSLAEESYFSGNDQYTSDLSALGFSPSPHVTLTFSSANASGWAATASHPAGDPGTCELRYGNAAGTGIASLEGVITCQ